MPVDRILQAIRDYLDEESALLQCMPDEASGDAMRRNLERPRTALREALADYEVWRIRGRVFHRVLVGVDSSEQSKWAVDVALKLAREEDATLCIVHVILEPPGFNSETYYPRQNIVAGLRAQAETLLTPIRERLARAGGAEVEELIMEGDPGREIVRAAVDWRADLIVLGTHTRGALGRLLMGSTAESVFRHAPCPVLIVRQSPAEVADTQLAIEALAQ